MEYDGDGALAPVGRPKRACDQCSYRKVKCDGLQPCSRCAKSRLDCSSSRSRPLKPSNGRRIQALRSSNAPRADAGSSLTVPEQRYALESPDSDRPVVNDYAASNSSHSPASIRDNHGNSQWVSPRQDHAPQHGRPFLSPDMALADRNQPGDWRRLEDMSTTPRDGESPTDPSSYMTLDEAEVMSWVEVFFDRLYSTVPVVDRAELGRDLMAQRHQRDLQFRAMIYSLCAFAMMQPVHENELGFISSRESRAKQLLHSAARARASYDFAENPNLVIIITSFFMFATLFNLRMQNSSWIQLREAVECGRLIGLHRPESYEGLTPRQISHRLRVYLVLSVTERSVALQRNHYISFTGQPLQDLHNYHVSLRAASVKELSGVVIFDSRMASATVGLLRLSKLCSAVDERVISCWNSSCSSGRQACTKVTIEQAVQVFNSIESAAAPSEDPNDPENILSARILEDRAAHEGVEILTQGQVIDISILRFWLTTRLWVSCLTHDLLDETSPHENLRPSYMVHIARQALDIANICGEDRLATHGIGIIERIYDIGMGVIMALQHCVADPASAPLIPDFEQLLQRFFHFLRATRGGNHPFYQALKKAFDSVQ
uniref:Zn(2)-C6 fungal-type domain-containing protein n=1 Tax=Bionectria ochroleuca TaxID=29856 RepID=A0A8H7N8C3_BIOOC